MATSHDGVPQSGVGSTNPISDFFLQVGRGLIDGISSVSKFGEAPNIGTASDPQDVWDFGASAGQYTFPTSAATLFISSSNNGDVVDIDTEGLDTDWAVQTQTQTLAGHTKTEIGSGLTWIRTYRAKNVGAANLAGTVYIYEDDTVTDGVPDTASKVRAVIMPTTNAAIFNNQTQMAIFPIPAGKKGYLFLWGASVNRAGTAGTKEADLVLQIREFGGVFQVKQNKSINNIGEGVSDRRWTAPLEVPAKSDVKVMVLTVSANDTAVSSWFDLLLVDE